MKRSKKIIPLIAMLVVSLGLLALAVIPTRYVSEWRVVEPNTTQTFYHGLGIAPAEVSATAGPVIPGAHKPAWSSPYLEFGDLQMKITYPSITMTNYGSEALFVRVVAEP